MNHPAKAARTTKKPTGLGRYRPYPEYKDSRVAGLGEVPKHWSIWRVKWATKKMICGPFGSSLTKHTYTSHGYRVYGQEQVIPGDFSVGDYYISPEKYTAMSRYAVEPGDVLVSCVGTFGKIAVVPDTAEPGIINPRLIKLSPNRGSILPDFSAEILRSSAVYAQLDETTRGGTMDIINLGILSSVCLTLPSLAEQRAIVTFLDRETGKIDALVEKKERLIELLQEKRTALITHAVTKGLDPDAPMKDSGVEWLGEIPTHWGVKRLWHLTPSSRKIMYGIVLPGPNVDDGIPIVKGGDVSADGLQLDRLNRTTYEIESRYERSRLKGGDLVYAIRGSIGDVEMVPAELEGANMTQDAARVAYRNDTHGRWLLQALRSRVVFAQLEAGALGATIRGINIRDLKRACLPVPPEREQHTIAMFLDRETGKIDGLVEKVQDAIDRLKEYRTALISAAVTGKIDVRGEVAA